MWDYHKGRHRRLRDWESTILRYLPRLLLEYRAGRGGDSAECYNKN